MKKQLSLFLALLMALTLLSGCGSKNTGDVNTDDLMQTMADYQDYREFMLRKPYIPDEVHDMDTASLVADYLSGAWDRSPQRSEDGLVKVTTYAYGFLVYTYYADGDNSDLWDGVDFYNSDALDMAKRVAAGEDRQSLPENWRGEKVYLDLPDQKLPEDALASYILRDVGTYVQTPDGVTLYYKQDVVDFWDIPAENGSLLSIQDGLCYTSGNYARADDKFFELLEGGKTKVIYDHVIDADTDAIPSFIILTLKNGVLTVHDGRDGFGRSSTLTWTKKVIAKDVAEACLISRGIGSDGVGYRTNDGEAFAVFRFLDNHDGISDDVASLGQMELDEIEKTWLEYMNNQPGGYYSNYYGNLRGFLEMYSEPKANAAT